MIKDNKGGTPYSSTPASFFQGDKPYAEVTLQKYEIQINRETAQTLMRHMDDGTYIIRNPQIRTPEHIATLTIKEGKTFKNYKIIKNKDGQLQFEKSQITGESLGDLITKYINGELEPQLKEQFQKIRIQDIKDEDALIQITKAEFGDYYIRKSMSGYEGIFSY